MNRDAGIGLFRRTPFPPRVGVPGRGAAAGRACAHARSHVGHEDAFMADVGPGQQWRGEQWPERSWKARVITRTALWSGQSEKERDR
jgi:hypothetical protein